MVLEATLLCLDNSEWSRNGDYAPNRFEAQQDAVNLICGSKTQMNPENAVGLLTMGGDRVEVQVAPTQDLGEILQALHGVGIAGKADFLRGIQTAQLALKHRMNKNQRQRIILFVGSPIDASAKALDRVGKTLKKNNVALDIVNFGEIDTNQEKVAALYQAVNANNTSHLVECPPARGSLLSDMLLASPIVIDQGEGEGLAGPVVIDPEAVAEASANRLEFGVDPNTDPELYLALRMSLEEEQARVRRAEQASGGGGTALASTPEEPEDAAPAEGVPPEVATTIAELEGMDEMDDELRQALLLSMQDVQDDPSPPASVAPEAAAEADTSSEPAPMTDTAAPVADPSGLQEALLSLPGVDVNDPRIQAALRGDEAAGSEEAPEPTEKQA